MKVIHFGAGNIGKGFIANVLSHNGFKICFVDVDPANIASIRKEKSYLVEILDPTPKIIEVNNVEILDGVNEQEQIIEQISHADLITTSLGVNNLTKVVPVIIQGLIARFTQSSTPINIIANENAINATNILKTALVSQLPAEHINILENVGFVNSAIDRQAVTRQYNQKQITAVEPFWEWVINQKEMVDNGLPKITDVTYVNELQPYIEKKLYIVNLGHATLAYLGFIANQATIFDTLSHESFKKFAQHVMQSSSKYLSLHYEFKQPYLDQYINDALTRFANPHLKDSVLRVAKSPIRKLGINERIIGPLLQLHKNNLPIVELCNVVAMALLFDDKTDPEATELQEYIRLHGVEEAIIHYTQIQDLSIISTIKQSYDKLRSIMLKGSATDHIKQIESILIHSK